MEYNVLTVIFLIIVIIAFIASGILLLKQSAKKFNLSDEQLENIKEREKAQKKKDDLH